MSNVKWIKITVNIFDDEKILLIESLPDADSIIVTTVPCWEAEQPRGIHAE